MPRRRWRGALARSDTLAPVRIDQQRGSIGRTLPSSRAHEITFRAV